MIRFVDREQDRTIRFEYETLPILLFEMPLMARTTARLGIQGWGPLPYRFDNRQRGLDSFRRRTAIASLTNRSRYFGYELYTVVGLIRDAKEFDSAARLAGNAGDLIIWRTALPHSASINRGARPRVAQYIAMEPARNDDKKARQICIDFWRDRLTGRFALGGRYRKGREHQRVTHR